MREVKFRMWIDSEDSEKYKGMYAVAEIQFDDDATYYKPYGLNFWTPNAEIMQYTGLKDKFGEEIYEGDIVKADNCIPEYEQVEFIEGGFCSTNPLIEGYPMDINSFYPSVGCMLEVVGNIYENAELLKL